MHESFEQLMCPNLFRLAKNGKSVAKFEATGALGFRKSSRRTLAMEAPADTAFHRKKALMRLRSRR
jgi:hypothetical protein